MTTDIDNLAGTDCHLRPALTLLFPLVPTVVGMSNNSGLENPYDEAPPKHSNYEPIS